MTPLVKREANTGNRLHHLAAQHDGGPAGTVDSPFAG
jgi:hypothetical protein